MKVLVAVLSTALLAIPAAAGAQAQQRPQAAPAVNPDDVICEKQDVTGSRLAHRKVCMTRSQWQDARRQDRATVEKAQSERGMNSSPTQPGG
jgi:hypothetical protein